MENFNKLLFLISLITLSVQAPKRQPTELGYEYFGMQPNTVAFPMQPNIVICPIQSNTVAFPMQPNMVACPFSPAFSVSSTNLQTPGSNYAATPESNGSAVDIVSAWRSLDSSTEAVVEEQKPTRAMFHYSLLEEKCVLNPFACSEEQVLEPKFFSDFYLILDEYLEFVAFQMQSDVKSQNADFFWKEANGIEFYIKDQLIAIKNAVKNLLDFGTKMEENFNKLRLSVNTSLKNLLKNPKNFEKLTKEFNERIDFSINSLKYSVINAVKALYGAEIFYLNPDGSIAYKTARPESLILHMQQDPEFAKYCQSIYNLYTIHQQILAQEQLEVQRKWQVAR